MKKKVYQILEKYIDEKIILEKPKDAKFGHFATPIAFSLAKKLRKSPMIIADELVNKIIDEPNFKEVTAIKGFVNIKLSSEFLDEYSSYALKNENKFGKSDKNKKILLEYVSANPTGPLHIGHARGAILGDTLYQIARHLGYEITSEYYINDAGNQIEMLGNSVFLVGQEEILNLSPQFPDEFYRGEYIKDLASKTAQKFGETIFEDKKNIEKISNFAKDEMLELIKLNLQSVNIEFDGFVSEKEMFKKWNNSLTKLEKNSAVYTKDDKLWLKSSECGDEKDRVVVRDNGQPTYLAGDVIYHDDKFKRNYDQYINIWGADHHGYIARVKSAIKFLGYDESQLEVILSQMVSLLKDGEPYKMSKRAGNFILMSDVVDEVGSDALRFIFLTKKSDTHLDFDIEMLKKEDSSNPVYYINYAHARINQVIAKSGKNIESLSDVKFSSLDESAENLLFNALLLPEVLEDVFNQKAPQKLADYLKTLAGSLHKFYNSHKVIGADNEDELLKLLATVAVSIRVGLKLIGIQAKYKM